MTMPGATAFTRISGAQSSAAASVASLSAFFASAYGPASGSTVAVRWSVTLTMQPFRLAAAKERMSSKGARKLTVNTSRIISGVAMESRIREYSEALFTRQSTGKSKEGISAETACISVKSHFTQECPAPVPPISSRSANASCRERLKCMTTRHPALAKVLAISAPMRLAAPVMRTVFISQCHS